MIGAGNAAAERPADVLKKNVEIFNRMVSRGFFERRKKRDEAPGAKMNAVMVENT